MFVFIKTKFVGFFASIINSSNHTKYVFLSKKRCKTQPTIISLNPYEYTEGLHCHLQLT